MELMCFFVCCFLSWIITGVLCTGIGKLLGRVVLFDCCGRFLGRIIVSFVLIVMIVKTLYVGEFMVLCIVWLFPTVCIIYMRSGF